MHMYDPQKEKKPKNALVPVKPPSRAKTTDKPKSFTRPTHTPMRMLRKTKEQMENLRQKFIERAKSYIGIPYRQKYADI